ncbi:hypothetical protein [Silvanigrella aquatica]|uniref:Uncharacterized protein n=1 Tax=Silvanigrella aquatica TaxID=1915309 RepID=A0A1L4D1Z4_9BACT|nr:hypothetical protein [Silvanigrella aquatica]APJ04216.1 hypothetical protein AXG55_09985 [Silvanigrella aquatica]
MIKKSLPFMAMALSFLSSESYAEDYVKGFEAEVTCSRKVIDNTNVLKVVNSLPTEYYSYGFDKSINVPLESGDVNNKKKPFVVLNSPEIPVKSGMYCLITYTKLKIGKNFDPAIDLIPNSLPGSLNSAAKLHLTPKGIIDKVHGIGVYRKTTDIVTDPDANQNRTSLYYFYGEKNADDQQITFTLKKAPAGAANALTVGAAALAQPLDVVID